ncbi:MAG TPA: toprim domain-containing protein [Hanamia sp.]|nr:toprim domain-containing protein [Hanamia sp.]
MNQLKSFQDFRNEISIIELALSVGYKIRKRDGIKWPVLKDEISGDKIIIVNPQSTSNQGYFNPQDTKDKGTLINFVKNRLGSVFPYLNGKSEAGNINAVLYNYQSLPLPEKNLFKKEVNNLVQEYSEKEFCLPDGLSELKDPTYLYYRGIQSQTINKSLFNGKIFNAKRNGFNNIGFPYYNASGDTVGFEIRNKQFKHVIEGTDRSVCIWHSNLPSTLENIILTESPIDALSYHQLKGKNNSLYVSFGGAVGDDQITTLKAIIKKANIIPEFKFISAVDNDDAGRKYTEKFKVFFEERLIVEVPLLKDFNEDLKKSQVLFKGLKM